MRSESEARGSYRPHAYLSSHGHRIGLAQDWEACRHAKYVGEIVDRRQTTEIEIEIESIDGENGHRGPGKD